MNEETTVPVADCEVYLGRRGMLLCHKHAVALIDLADGNGVKLEIYPLDPELEEPCGACWAAIEAGYPQIILPD
jgi:hypothetical protein